MATTTPPLKNDDDDAPCTGRGQVLKIRGKKQKKNVQKNKIKKKEKKIRKKKKKTAATTTAAMLELFLDAMNGRSEMALLHRGDIELNSVKLGKTR